MRARSCLAVAGGWSIFYWGGIPWAIPLGPGHVELAKIKA